MALTATERERVEEAVRTLARYNKDPFITDFLKQQPKPRIPGKFDKDDLCDLIKEVLLGAYRGKKKYALKLDDMIAYLDRLQENGRQHLYLFRLPEEGRDALLARLRDLNEVKALLGVDDDLYDEGGRLIWEARDVPQLALVRHDPPGAARPTHLVLKWVETRAFSYWALQNPTGPSESGEPSEEGERQEAEEIEDVEEEEESRKVRERIRVEVTGEERATTFFVVNLEDGDCELRIQALRGLARVARQQQLATYRALVAGLFGLEPVGPTVLAPAIRRSLLAREVQIVRCVAILPNGGLFIGGRGELPPVDIRDLQAGVAIRFVWPQSSGGRVELDGRLDEVLILRPLLPEQHRMLLERVRHWRQEGLALFTTPAEPMPVGGRAPRVKGRPDADIEDAPPPRGKFWSKSLKVAFVSGVRLEPPAEPGIDRATREYTRTHVVEESGGDPFPAGKAESPDAVPPITVFAGDERPLKQFLGYIREVAQNENSTYQHEIKLVRSEEQWNFRLSIIAAVLALVIVATGAILLLFYPVKLIGTVTALLGVLTGRGTVLISRYAKNLKTKRELIQDQQRDSQQTLLAIQTALSIPDREVRSRAMTGVASSLLARVTGLVQSSKQIPVPKQAGDAQVAK